MASIIKRVRKQRAVYWAQSGRDNNGQRTYALPVEIACRWKTQSEELKQPSAESIMSVAKVMVDRDMLEGDFLMLGELDSNVPDDPEDTNIPAYLVAAFKSVPDFKAREFYRVAYMSARRMT